MAGLFADTGHHVLEAKANGQHHLDGQELVSVRTNYRTIIDAGHEVNPAHSNWSTRPAPTMQGAQLVKPT